MLATIDDLSDDEIDDDAQTFVPVIGRDASAEPAAGIDFCSFTYHILQVYNWAIFNYFVIYTSSHPKL